MTDDENWKGVEEQARWLGCCFPDMLVGPAKSRDFFLTASTSNSSNRDACDRWSWIVMSPNRFLANLVVDDVDYVVDCVGIPYG